MPCHSPELHSIKAHPRQYQVRSVMCVCEGVCARVRERPIHPDNYGLGTARGSPTFVMTLPYVLPRDKLKAERSCPLQYTLYRS